MADGELTGCLLSVVIFGLFIIAIIFSPLTEGTRLPVKGDTVTVTANGVTYKGLEYLSDGPSDDSDSIICRDTDGTIRIFVGSYEISLEAKAEKDERSELSPEVVDRNISSSDPSTLSETLLH